MAGEEVIVVGMSSNKVCGVRGYAEVTAGALAATGAPVCTVWFTFEPAAGPFATLRRFGRFLRSFRRMLDRRPGASLLVHYSVFAYGWRGVPVLAWPLTLVLVFSRRPTVIVMHEFALRFRAIFSRASLLATLHRLTLPALVGASDAVVVLTDARGRWFMRRNWIPSKPVLMVPATSPLPECPRRPDRSDEDGFSIGVFGYAHEGSRPDLVLRALAHLRQAGLACELVLIGQPGAASSAGRAWVQTARDSGEPRPSFTGSLSKGDIVSALQARTLIVSPYETGPESRKTTIASTLAAGAPLVALDGPDRWNALSVAGAVQLAPAAALELAAVLASLIRDDEGRRSLGVRGRSFYEANMSPLSVAAGLRRAIATAEHARGVARQQ